MSKVCFYFELHQPYRLEDFSIFDLGSGTSYFEVSGQERNRVIFQKVARKSYVPMLRLLLNLVRKHQDFYSDDHHLTNVVLRGSLLSCPYPTGFLDANLGMLKK